MALYLIKNDDQSHTTLKLWLVEVIVLHLFL